MSWPRRWARCVVLIVRSGLPSDSSRGELEAVLAGAAWRALGLWGTAGVGKSFLARKAFPRDSEERWIHVGLEAAHDGVSAARLLMEALHPGSLSGAEQVPELARLLNAEAPLGLVLDDADGVAGWMAEVVGELLDRVPDLRVVITQRERPDHLLEGLPSARVIEVAPLTEDAARALFGELAARLGVQVPQAHGPFVGQLCHELGGLPLALELAAARLDVLPVPALLHRIRSQGMQLGQGNKAGRHVSLEAVLVSSWQGLQPELQALLMVLAWPSAGANLEELEAVLEALGAGHGLPAAGDALELFAALRRRAWLLRDAERLLLSPPLRRFVLTRTPSEQAQRIELAWAEHYASEGDGVQVENLYAVLERASGAPQLSTRYADAALRLISRGFAQPLELGGELSPGLERVLSKVIERSHSSGASLPLICEAMALQAKAQLARGEPKGASALALRALDFARRAARSDLELLSLLVLSTALAETGQLKDARSTLERARDLVGPGTDPWRSLELAEAYRALQELDAARVQGERCLARIPVEATSLDLCRAAARLLLADVCADLSDDAGMADQLRGAEELIRGARSVAAGPLQLAHGLSLRLGYLRGREALHGQRLAVAEGYFSEAASGFSRQGSTRRAALARYHLGITRRERGQAGAAFVELELAMAQLPAGSRAWSFCALHLAQLEREARAESRALRLFGQVREQAQRVGLEELADLAGALSRGGPSPFAAEHSLRELDLRVLERCASRRQTQSLRSEPDSWLVARDGSWFRPPGGEQIPLGKRKALSSILGALAEAREAGAGCRRAQLIDAGWPGERILEAAATQRLRVALSTLRKLGLEPLIRTLDDGYALGSDVPVARV